MAAEELLCSLDPAEWATRRLGFTPDERQAEVLRCTEDQVLLNCCRQWGKSTVAALLALHTGVFEPGSTTLICSRSWRQSSELFKKVAAWVVQTGIETVDLSKLQATLGNGSRIISLPGEEATIRGFAADRVIIDEAARTEDLLLAALRPMLAVTRGRLLALSTPAGVRGWFYEAWTHGGADWRRFKVMAEEVPERIAPEFLERERRGLPAWLYEQEYECAFVEGAGAVFATAFIDTAFRAGEELAPLWPELSEVLR